MTFDIVKQNYLNGVYQPKKPVPFRASVMSPDTVIDEEKSVKWNREEVARRNENSKREHEQLVAEKYRLRDQFKEDLYQASYSEYKLNRAQYNALYEYVMYSLSEYDYECSQFIVDFEAFLDFFFTTVNLKETD